MPEEKTKTRRNRVRIIRAEHAEGMDEMNLMEYPFASLWMGNTKGQVILNTWEVVDPVTNKKIPASWRVAGDPEMGLPTSSDVQLFLGLMSITAEAGWPQRVPFSRHGLIKRLGWSHTVRYYQMLNEGFMRLKAVNITAVNAFYDKSVGTHKSRIAFSLINDYKIFDEKPGPKPQHQLPLSYFEWNSVFYKSLRDGYIRSIDLEFVKSLKRPLSIALYRYLSKKQNNGPRFSIGLSRLCYMHLGMKETKYESVLRQRLAPAHEELVNKGFLSEAIYDEMSSRDGQKVTYVFNTGPRALEQGSAEAVKPNNPSSAERGVRSAELPISDLEKLLIERGVTGKIANQLATEMPDECRAQLEYLDYRKGRQDKAATLVKSIRESWAAPPEWETAQEAKRADERARAAAEQFRNEKSHEAEQQQENERINALYDQMYQALDVHQRERIDAEAADRLGVLGRIANNEIALKAMRRTLLREKVQRAAQE